MFAKDATPARAKPETVHRLLAELDNLYCYAESNRNGRLCHIVDEARTVLAKKLPSS
jgi:hypothetical protein